MNQNENCLHPLPNYAIKIDFAGLRDEEINRAAREVCCSTCGWPLLQGGEICPDCINLRATQMRTAIIELQYHLNPRIIHSSTHGLIDPWSDEGRAILDD